MQPNKLGLQVYNLKWKLEGTANQDVYALTQKSSSIMTITSSETNSLHFLNKYVKGYKKVRVS